MSKDINIEQILYDSFHAEGIPKHTHSLAEITQKAVKNAVKEACRQTLELAAENALLNIDGVLEKSNGQQYLVDEGNHYSETNIWIDKSSIINVIDQIK